MKKIAIALVAVVALVGFTAASNADAGQLPTPSLHLEACYNEEFDDFTITATAEEFLATWRLRKNANTTVGLGFFFPGDTKEVSVTKSGAWQAQYLKFIGRYENSGDSIVLNKNTPECPAEETTPTPTPEPSIEPTPTPEPTVEPTPEPSTAPAVNGNGGGSDQGPGGDCEQSTDPGACTGDHTNTVLIKIQDHAGKWFKKWFTFIATCQANDSKWNWKGVPYCDNQL